MNIENLLINRVVRGTLFNRLTNEVIFSLDEISNPTLECGGEQVYATDALGQNIAAFDRSKTASFSGENAMFNFGLMAAQFGSDKETASSEPDCQSGRTDRIDSGMLESALLIKKEKRQG